ncbi:MAG: DUF1631 family protein, partial [Gammaproteobacteria bacterium]
MDKAEQSTTSAGSPGNESSLLQSAKTIAVKHLKKQLQELFSGVDDVMFEYGNKSETSEKQNEYFDAMRQIRKDQKSAAQHFLVTFNQYFDDAVNGQLKGIGGHTNTEEDFSYTSLSLIEEDDLEESLAFTNMIEKAQGMYREELVALAQRFHEIVKSVEFNAENNPVSPNNICHAFEQGAEKLDVSIDIKLVIYKLFEKSVVTQLDTMYHAINEMFVNAGILPTIKLKKPVKSESQDVKSKPQQAEAPEQTSQQQAAAQPPVPMPTGEVGQVSFDSLQQMLSAQRGDAGGGPPPPGGVYVPADVLSGLTQLQGNFMEAAADLSQLGSVEDVKNTLLAALSQGQDGEEKGIDSNESDVIDIVSMMFEFILDDKTLSDRIRAEIARLQIPVIKVAILDKQFFDEKKHPARLLLNELAYAGTSRQSQEEAGEDMIFKKVEYVVNRVLAEFETNVGIFDELLQEFKEFIESELQNNKQSEQRLEKTKQTVSDEMEKRLKDNKVPKLVYDLLLNRWKDVLTRVGMKHNCSGTSWNACLDVVDDLVWSVQPK